MFQLGAFVRHNFGATYLTASAAYGWQDVTTDRYVTAAGVDHLRAEFNTNSYSGRLELGHRFRRRGSADWVIALRRCADHRIRTAVVC